jgi:hypothetical protein
MIGFDIFGFAVSDRLSRSGEKVKRLCAQRTVILAVEPEQCENDLRVFEWNN